MTKLIEEYIVENITEDSQKIALDFIAFLRSVDVEFFKDNGVCWKDKIYYWLKYNHECIAFIAINNPDEPDNLWTVWFDDCSAYNSDILDDEIKNTAWKHIDYCDHCGSCGGGKSRIIFGKKFNGVCGCTFRIDNPQRSDLPFLKKMVELCKANIHSNDTTSKTFWSKLT